LRFYSKEDPSDEEHEANDEYYEDESSNITMNIQGPNPKPTPPMNSKGAILATLSGMNQYFTIKFPREVLGEKILVLIYGGVIHNFVNEKLAIAKKMKIEPFSSFYVLVGNGNITTCKKYMPKMKISLKEYTIECDFFIFPLG